jgi:D-alanyl-D-alanine carboxypeptidase
VLLAVPAAIAVTATLAFPAVAAARNPTDVAALKPALHELVDAKGGPPGAIVTLYRDGHLTVVSAGRADIHRPGAPRATDHMRIASVSKAFNGAIVLHLVQRGLIGLDDTIGRRLPNLPAAWAEVTVRQMLEHTAGLPDYTKSGGFYEHLGHDPQGYVPPTTIVGWVDSQPLSFRPGSRYEYSNTDNIVLGLIAEAATGESYGTLLRQVVSGPAKLHQTLLPSTVSLPTRFIHGYDRVDGKLEDASTSLSPSGAWASGGIVSTPADLNRFIRSLLARAFFGHALQLEQMHFVPGSSSPDGPGTDSAGLGIYRYRTRCGTVYGHTGGIPGYTQFAAATRDGKRAVTVSLNITAPTSDLANRVRSVQTTAICALLRRKG